MVPRVSERVCVCAFSHARVSVYTCHCQRLRLCLCACAEGRSSRPVGLWRRHIPGNGGGTGRYRVLATTRPLIVSPRHTLLPHKTITRKLTACLTTLGLTKVTYCIPQQPFFAMLHSRRGLRQAHGKPVSKRSSAPTPCAKNNCAFRWVTTNADDAGTRSNSPLNNRCTSCYSSHRAPTRNAVVRGKMGPQMGHGGTPPGCFGKRVGG